MLALIEKSETNGVKLAREEIERQKNDVNLVVKYCQNVTDCRRSQVLAYFGEQFDPRLCNKQCNNCVDNDGATLEDMSEPGIDALKLAKAILSGRDRFTLIYVMDVFRGSQKKDIRDRQHHLLTGAGTCKLDRDQTDRLFSHLLAEEALVQESVLNRQGWHTTYLAVSAFHSLVTSALFLTISELRQMGPTAEAFVSGRKPLMMMVQRRRAATAKKPPTRIVRKAVVSTTRTSITEEERSIVMDVEEEEEEDAYRPDPIEEDYDDFPKARTVLTRSTRVPESRSKPHPSKTAYVDEIEDDDAPAGRPAARRGEGDDRTYAAFKDLRQQVGAPHRAADILTDASSKARDS